MQKRGFLTDMQVMAAYQFSRAPNQFQLAPSLFRVLHDVIITEKSLTDIEAEKGWPARSAKQIVSLLLNAVLECRGDTIRSGIDVSSVEDLTERIEILTGSDPKRQIDVMREFGFTSRQARIWLIIASAHGAEITKDALILRLEADRDDDDISDSNLKVQICHMRKKIEGSRYEIETMWGIGYRIVVKSIECDPKLSENIDLYVAHVIGGQSMRQLARDLNVVPSTVLRRIRRIEDMRDQPGFDAIIDRAEKKHKTLRLAAE